LDEGETAAIHPDGGIFEALTWLGRGFFQPLYSVAFYRAVCRRPLVDAILFFIAFGVLSTLVATFRLTRDLGSAADELERVFATEEIPEIVIANGVATVRAPQPVVLLDEEGTIVVLDTSGRYQSIDRSRYSQGILLTRDNLHLLSDSDYRITDLVDLNQAFGDPIVVNRGTALEFWQTFSRIFAAASLVGIGLWLTLARFIWLTFLAVLVWGILSALKVRSEYGPVLAAGIYALVPAVYITFLLGQVGVRFCGIETILLLIFWVVFARLAIRPVGSGTGSAAVS
jgi:hypothetical protein